jgi:large subunit ribosomal protein L6
MSRIGRLPVPIPDKVEISINGAEVKIKGPKGELVREINEHSALAVEDGVLLVSPVSQSGEARALHGLTRSLVANMVTGVSEGYVRVLEINGVGYKAEILGSYMRFDLGFSHPIFFELPVGVAAEVDRRGIVKLTGIDKEILGAAAAKIRSFRPPEPYKGKGIKYAEEVIVRKVGKSGAR